MKKLIVTDSVFFSVYVLGYKGIGESIIFTLESSNTIIYSGVIDCYEQGSINRTIDKLGELGIEELDIICWTHPHEDHTVGMGKLIDQFSSAKTTIVYPMYLCDIKDNLSAEMLVVTQKINDISTSMKRNKPNLEPVCNVNIIDEKQIIFGDQQKYFSIKSLTPIGNTMEKRFNTNSMSDINDLSVSLLIDIGGYKFFFGGDIEDSAIKKIKSFAIPDSGVSFLKIPHHASDSSTSLLDWFKENRVDICCTTESKRHRLPKKNVLDEYKKVTDLLISTGEHNQRKYNYGIIHTKMDIMKNQATTTLLGDAYYVHKAATVNSSKKYKSLVVDI